MILAGFSSLLRRFSGKTATETVSQTIGFATGQAAASAIVPEVQPLANEAWANSPTMPAPFDMAIAAAIKDPNRDERARRWANEQGFSDEVYETARVAAASPPGAEELLTLLNRGELTSNDVIEGFRSGLIEERWLVPLLKLAVTPLSPAEAATARQQGFITADRQREVAALAGVDATDAELQFQIVGLPPGVAEALVMLRRGLIDDATFAQIVAEGHTKTKYTDVLRELQWQPLSSSIAAEALIRQRITEDEAVKIAEINGMKKEDFLTWSNMLGRPIAVGEALTLVNRGEMTEAEFGDVVARSDVRTEYTDQLLKLRVHYPSLIQITHAVAAGSISDKIAADTLKLEGYTEDWITAIITASHKQKTQKSKDLSLSVVATLFDAGLEDEHDALEQIKTLGYDDVEAAQYLELHEARRYVSELTRATNIIRAKYVARVIDEATARTMLDVLGLRDSTKRRLITIWSDERDANIRVLTPAQTANAFRYSIISFQESKQRLQHIGYSEADAQILLELTAHGPLTEQGEVPPSKPVAITPAAP